MREKVLSFLEEAFMESEKRFEPEGRHYAFNGIERNFMKFWCAFDGEDIVGTAAVKKISETVCELKGLYVYEKYHGQKIGYSLAKTAVDFAKDSEFEKIVLDTMTRHEKALRLYKKMGFEQCERYNDNDKAEIFMELLLKKSNIKYIYLRIS